MTNLSEEHLEDHTSLIVDSARDALHATTASKATKDKRLASCNKVKYPTPSVSTTAGGACWSIHKERIKTNRIAGLAIRGKEKQSVWGVHNHRARLGEVGRKFILKADD